MIKSNDGRPQLSCGQFRLDLSKPVVMGILNLTPDSFSDGGRYNGLQAAVERAGQLVSEGAALIDIGAESTRPGAKLVDVNEELDRLMPVLEALVPELTVPISIDTRKPQVMTATIAAGASMINSVDAFTPEGALDAVKDHDVALCLMHMRGEPATMQLDVPVDVNIVFEVKQSLQQRLFACAQAGIDKSRLVVDPGFGFGKTPEQNCQLLHGLGEFANLGYPVMLGCSRKSTIGHITNRPVDQRLGGSLACAAMAVQQGAKIIRAHDVSATVDVIEMVHAIQQIR